MHAQHLASAVLVLALANVGQAATAFYVATNGSDTNTGTISLPFATFERASAAVRALNKAGPLPAGGVTVWIRGGNYFRDTTFELTSADSGTSNAPIVYSGYSNELVRVIGGRFLTGLQPVTDSAVLQRLSAQAQTNVLQVGLATCGITNDGQLRERGYGIYYVPAHLELFFNEQPMTLARYPNTPDWAAIAGVPGGGQRGAISNGFYYSSSRPSTWSTNNDVWAAGYWGHAYTFFVEHVASINTASNLVMFSLPNQVWDGFLTNQPYFFLNVLEELDSPGEYYVDTSAGQLYFWPPTPIGTNEVMASQMETPLVWLYYATNVSFANIRFEGTRSGAIKTTQGSMDSIRRCDFRATGGYGIYLNHGYGYVIDSCSFSDMGDEGATFLYVGDRQTLTPSGSLVNNCTFQRIARWSKVNHPAVNFVGVGGHISHNLIHDHPNSAMMPAGNDIIIEYNEIYNVDLETPSEAGIIYFGHDYTRRGIVVRYNYIHDVGVAGQSQSGIYLDDCASGVLVMGNIFEAVSQAVVIGGGRDNTIDNNIFVNCPNAALLVDGRGLDPYFSNRLYGIIEQEFYSVPTALYSSRYAGVSDIDALYQQTNHAGIPPANNIVSHNICVNGTWSNVNWYATPSMLTWTNNYVGPDPGFVDLSNRNFNLKADSPVWQLGFSSILITSIGVKTNGVWLAPATDLHIR